MVRFFRRKGEEPPEPPPSPEAPTPAEAVEPGVEPAEAAAEGPATVEQAVERTRRTWFSRIGGMFRRGLDDELWEELEETLIAADTGVQTTAKVLDGLRERVKSEGIRDPEQAQEALKAELLAALEVHGAAKGQLWGGDGGWAQQAGAQQAAPLHGVAKPAIILVVGVNGTGKTTSIGKLAHAYREAGQKVLLAAADTFRAAAIDQLKQWGELAGVDVIAHQQGADPGAVVFDAIQAAEARGADLLIIDTAGRLHTKFHLMEELRKVNRIIERKDPTAPHEVLLVLDATSGQNALHQAKYFTEAVGVTGILLAKLDGTAKGGVIFAVCDQLGVPVRFIGTGEKASDLAAFEPKQFVDALFA
ncbi:MAG: signal recognition particle-docking protein FtsY [Dehalococcoidia bacterium]|nr:signal recognition particle-docking protein FtsY [Dehalococcoidia bacterium]